MGVVRAGLRIGRVVGMAALASAIAVWWAGRRTIAPRPAPAASRAARPPATTDGKPPTRAVSGQPPVSRLPPVSQRRPLSEPPEVSERQPVSQPRPVTQLRPVSVAPHLFRSGRVAMWIEGTVLVSLGGWGIIEHTTGSAGALSVLASVLASMTATTPHSIGLVMFGLLTVLVTVHRRATVILLGIATVGLVLLFTIGINLAADDVRGAWGFTYASSALHAILLAINLALLMWIGGEALEGTPWVRVPIRRAQRPGPGTQHPTRPTRHREDTRRPGHRPTTTARGTS